MENIEIETPQQIPPMDDEKMKLLYKKFDGNSTVTLKFSLASECSSYISTAFVIGGIIECLFRADVMYMRKANSKVTRKVSIFEKFSIVNKGMTVHPTIWSVCLGVNSDKKEGQDGNTKMVLREISDDHITYIDDIWHLKGQVTAEHDHPAFTLYFRISLIFSPNLQHPAVFHGFHDIATPTDFELCGGDGSINLHKVVLAASSPMLNTMLSGQWKETSKGKVELAGITAKTLDDLKAYIYSHKLPSHDKKVEEDVEGSDQMYRRVEELLKLACYLMMSDLIHACTVQLLIWLTHENAFELLHLATTYQLKNLFKGIILSHDIKSIDLCELVDPESSSKRNWN